MKKMELAFVSKYPTLDIRNWSGLEYFIAQSIEQQGGSLDYISGLEDRLSLSVRLKSKIYGRNKKYWIKRSPELGKGYAKQILEKIKPSTDIIFSASTEPIAYLDCSKPKVFYTDATFASMIGYYDWFDNLSSRTIKEALAMEQRALDTSSLAFFSSDWAAQSAINDFNANPDKMKVIPFGANINTRLTLDDIQASIKQKDGQRCKILFLAVEWYRKGGDIVLEAVKYMNEYLKLPTELHIVGIDNLPVENLPSYVINHGRISKATSGGISKIENLICQSHFLFIPSRADCTPIVFSEAMAFGVPCISTNTGGIPTIIKDEINGAILDMNSSPKDYAEKIYTLFTNRTNYEQLSLSAFNDFETRLNWNAAGQTIMRYLKEL